MIIRIIRKSWQQIMLHLRLTEIARLILLLTLKQHEKLKHECWRNIFISKKYKTLLRWKIFPVLRFSVFLRFHKDQTGSVLQKKNSRKDLANVYLVLLLRKFKAHSQVWVSFWQLKTLSKNDKKCFYFIFKALFALKVFKFLSWNSGSYRKTTW